MMTLFDEENFEGTMIKYPFGSNQRSRRIGSESIIFIYYYPFEVIPKAYKNE